MLCNTDNSSAYLHVCYLNVSVLGVGLECLQLLLQIAELSTFAVVNLFRLLDLYASTLGERWSHNQTAVGKMRHSAPTDLGNGFQVRSLGLAEISVCSLALLPPHATLGVVRFLPCGHRPNNTCCDMIFHHCEWNAL